MANVQYKTTIPEDSSLRDVGFDSFGFIVDGLRYIPGQPPALPNMFQSGAMIQNIADQNVYVNTGTPFTVVWEPIQKGGIQTVKQGNTTLDLTSLNDTSLIVPVSQVALPASYVIPTRLLVSIGSAVAADSQAPIVTVQDTSGSTTNLSSGNNISDGDGQGRTYQILSDGITIAPINLNNVGIEVAVTQEAQDSGTAAGKANVLLEYMIVN